MILMKCITLDIPDKSKGGKLTNILANNFND